jgi:Mrp family chromosome partitioning ATPase
MERIQTALQKAREQRGSDQLAEQTFSSCLRLGSEVLWETLPKLSTDPKLLARNRIVTPYRSDTAYVTFDMLRTAVLQQMRQNNWKSVAVTSPTPGCGKSVVSLNLAFSLANQKECRTALIDLDLRRPQIAKLLGMKTPPSVESFLRGHAEVEDVFVRYGDNLAIAGNGRPVRFAAELLQSSDTAKTFKTMKQKLDPDVLIIDMPPMLSSDDVPAFLPNVDCAILIVAAEMTTVREADICESSLAEKTNVLGVVLNKCRYTPDKYGY